MFENITKGVAKSTYNNSKERGVRTEHGFTCFLPKPFHYTGQDQRYDDELEETKQNAEFIAYCFNLQQRYDISKLEECVRLLEESNTPLNLYQCRDLSVRIEEFLTKIKK